MSDNATIVPVGNRSEYDDIPGINWSVLKHCIDHPSKAMYAMLNPKPPTPRMALGSAIHSISLEGYTKFKKSYAKQPEGIDRRTKAGKEAYSEFVAMSKGKQVMSADDYETAMRVSDSIAEHPAVKDLLNPATGRAEQVIKFELTEGLVGKGILDWLPTKDGHPIVDLKTTRDASPYGFARQMANLRYHGQACYYRRALAALNGEPLRDFVFIAVEVEPPYCIGVYKLNLDAIDAGERMVDMAIDRWLAATTGGDGDPHYTDYIEDLGIPTWAMAGENANVAT